LAFMMWSLQDTAGGYQVQPSPVMNMTYSTMPE
jgi:hypothetical protein